MTKDNPDNAQPGQHETHPMEPVERTVMLDVPRELGCYQLKRLLGRGGMGEVWLAHDRNLDREVAIKLMRKELLQNEDANRRFAREARAVGRLNHPNIVHVYSFGDEKGLLYFAMEYVDGETVSQKLKRIRCFELPDAIMTIMQAIEGLGYACERGIVHRDIKPSNLMLTKDGRVKIADFGLAKMVQHDTQVTAAGTAMGSPNYMSPEQARGEEADHRSDIYALGVSLYQMLCGTLPFTADSPLSVLLKHIQDPLPEPADLRDMKDGAILNVIKRMTAKRPEDRYQTYGELATALLIIEPLRGYHSAHVATASLPAAQAPASGGNTASLPHAIPNPKTEPHQPADGRSVPHSMPAENKSPALIIALVAITILLLIAGLAMLLTSLSDGDNTTTPMLTGEQTQPATPQTSPVSSPVDSVDPTPETAMPSQTAPTPQTAQQSIPSAQNPAPSPANAVAGPAASAGPSQASSATPYQSTSPVTSPTMQPVDVSVDLPYTPTPFPGQTLQPTPRIPLRDLMPEGIPSVAPRQP